jgi:hypothetical protein
MIGRRSPWLVVALLGAALVAGCGSSSSTTSSSTTTSKPATTTSKPATTTSKPATTSTAARSAVAICKSIIQRVPTLSASVKAKVEGICNKAASGGLAGARAAAKEVCVEVVNASPISGAAKEKDLAACKAAS